MSCLFPKAGDLKAYWENILNKVNAISDVPPERWDADLFFDTDKKGRDKIYSRWGGFLDPIVFDPLKYGLPPNALKSIDPLQLLSLEAAGRALEDAGIPARPIDRENTACFFGIAGGMGDFGMQYGVRAALPLYLRDIPEELLRQLPEWTEDSFPGILPNVVSGRIANTFDLGGSNFTVDAACASGLTALYLGVRELVMGTANAAIVGATDVLQTPFGFLCFAKTQALTPSGKPKPFDASADGIVISEGIGVTVLKRLADAERDGDRIYAVIRGVGSSSDGRGKSLTAPQAKGQKRALEAAYRMAGGEIGPLELVEAHGTGTVLGDGTEAETIHDAMRARGAPARSCAVGSVKSQIGHTKGCAGIAGLIKTALALHYKVLPPTINVTRPAARVFVDPKSPVYVNTEPRPWIAGAQPRRAGVNSFGFGGTNFHALMEEYTGPAGAPARFPLETWPAELFMWAADTHENLDAALAKIAAALAGKSPRLRDVARAVCVRRGTGAMRLALTAESIADLADKIAAARKHLAAKPESVRDPRGIFFSAKPVKAEGKMAFLFPGQGSQRPDMLRDLTVLFPELRDTFAAADRALADRLDRPLSRYIFPPPRFSPEEEQQALKEITVTNIAQPALGACEMGMHRLLVRLGIQPDMTAGHSSGEYAALAAAGVLPEEHLYTVLEDRGSSILETATGDLGTMMAAKGSATKVESVIQGLAGVYVANFNSPEQTILSGLKKDLDAAAAALEAAGIKCKFFPVGCAFHSPIIEPARRRLASTLETISYAAPAIPVYSNVSGAPYSGDTKETLALLSEHLIASVRFTDEIEAMYRDGARVFVEVGPGQVLTGLVNQILKGRRFVAVATDSKSTKHDIVTFQGALAQLYAEGVEVDTSYFFAGREIESLDPETLTPLAPAKKPSAAAWVVAPDRAWPVSQTRPVRTRISMKPPPVPAAAAPTALPKSMETPSAPTPPVTLPAPASPAAAEVVLKYQRMMATFLEQQKEIMMAYLGGAPIPPPTHALPQLDFHPSPAAAPAVQETKAATPAPAPTPRKETAPNKTEPTSANSMQERLLKLVAERTGYPLEMLGLHLDLESDLGIDSIKRLEILIEFAKSIPGAPEDLPEKLSGARTLAAVLEGVAPFAAKVSASAPSPTPAPARSAAQPKPAPAPQASLQERLIALVAERTGYPPEMLELHLDVESDLGIDSIKRLEILIEFAKSIPGAPEDLPEKLSGARTLAAVLEGVASLSAPVPSPPAPAVRREAAPISESTPTNSSARAHRILIGLDAAPLPTADLLLPPTGAIVITTDGQGAAEALARQLDLRGAKTVIAAPDQFDTPDRAASLIDEVRSAHGQIGGLLHLLPLRAMPDLSHFTCDRWRRIVREEVKGLFHLLRAAALDLKTADGAWVLACASLGRRANNGCLPPPSYPWRGGLMGLLKSIADEWPKALCKIIDTDNTAPDFLTPRLLEELAAPGTGCEIYYRAQKRWVPRTYEEPVDRTAARIDIAPDDVIMIIGGARGITAEVALEIARAHRPTLLLVGRSAWPADESPLTADLADPSDIKKALFADRQTRGESPKPIEIENACRRILNDREMRATRAALERAGSKVFYYTADVQDGASLEALFARVNAEHGRLDGVINGAGIIEDKLIEDKTPESFDRVFDNKVDAVFHLSRLLDPAALKFFVLFSSIAGWRGNRGQADYAAANEVLNRMAMYLGEQWGRRVVAIDWGPWRTVGMATEGVQRQFKERGIGLISPEAGRRFLLDEIRYGDPAQAIVVAEGPLDG